MLRALHQRPDIIRWMGPLTLKLMAVLVLSVQILAGVSPGRSAWCFGFGLGNCDSSIPATQAEVRGCCAGCPAESPLPTPVHEEDRCPPGCECCIEITVPELPTLIESGQSARDLQQSALLCKVLAHVWPADEPLFVAIVRGGAPPDRPSLPRSLGLEAIRLLV